MKKVLHVVNRMGYGGIETFLMNVYRNVDRNSIQFDFAVHTDIPGDYDEEIKKMGGHIYYFTSRRKSFIKYYQDWKNFLKNNSDKYIAIHMHVSSLTTILPIVLAKKYKMKKRIIHAHSTLQEGKLHQILSALNKKRVNKYATNLIACSTMAGNYVFGNNKYEILKNGINIKKFEFDENKRKEIRNKFGIKDNETVYINIGRLIEAKNQTYLLDIFKEIYNEDKSSRLFIIGKGELKDKIEQKIEKSKLKEQITLLENRNDISDILQGMDIFILPSLYEGLPIVAIEAQSAGLKSFISKNVTEEVKVTDLVDFIDINDNYENVAKYILENKNYERKKYENKELSNYDIKNISNYLVNEIYLK